MQRSQNKGKRSSCWVTNYIRGWPLCDHHQDHCDHKDPPAGLPQGWSHSCSCSPDPSPPAWACCCSTVAGWVRTCNETLSMPANRSIKKSKTLKSSKNSSFVSSERCSINFSFLRNSFKHFHVKIFIRRVFISAFYYARSLKIFHCSFSHCFRRNKACLEHLFKFDCICIFIEQRAIYWWKLLSVFSCFWWWTFHLHFER